MPTILLFNICKNKKKTDIFRKTKKKIRKMPTILLFDVYNNNEMKDIFRKTKKQISEKYPPFCYFCIYQKSYDMRYSH